jgi:glycosyltransferase involved in cell wall biosynthesis
MVRSTRAIGGAEIYNLNLIRGFRRYYPEMKIIFITNLPIFAKRIKLTGAQVFLLPVFDEEVGTKRGLVRLVFALPKYLFYYLKTILFLRVKKSVKLAIFQGTTEKIVLTPLLKVLKFEIIWLEHGPFFAFRKTKLVLILYRLLSCLADKIVTVSKDAKEDLIKNEINKKKIVWLPTGIDINYFKPLPKRPKKGSVVGFLGALISEKGINEFIEVAEEILKIEKGVKFMLVGEGRKTKRKNFVYCGFQKDIRSYLGQFDLFFFPTWHLEGISLAVLEAMAMGVPVVTRDIGGNRELVVHGKTGYLFKNESPEELAELIIRLLKDPEKRKKMGIEARKRVAKYFNLKRWVTDLYKVFMEVAKE